MTSLVGRLRRRWVGPSKPRVSSEAALRNRIVEAGGSLHPARPGPGWHAMRDRALRTAAEVDAAVAEVRALGLVPHGDAPKNFDHLVALGAILEDTTPDADVLEMGAAVYSPLLTWLYQYGYRSLVGIDLTYRKPIHRGPIRLEGMDLTKTTFEDGSFDAISCLSVIEHGVDPAAYLREARRLLRPGGVLVTSTDYWVDPVDTGDLTAYGGPVRIFSGAEIAALVDDARRMGFRAAGPIDLSCGERVVHWARVGLDFTFIAFVLHSDG